MCISSSCGNDVGRGTCNDTSGSVVCNCTDGWQGVNCSQGKFYLLKSKCYTYNTIKDQIDLV